MIGKPDLLVSDLHLSLGRPGITRDFLHFLKGPAAAARSLYILGDLFDYWLGDDDLGDPLNASVLAALRTLSDQGVALSIMVGNRDFLLREGFTTAANARLLTAPAVEDLAGVPTILMHGDSLCTDDLAYQAFRAQCRTPAWQEALLARPLEERRAIAMNYRRMSEEAKGAKSEEIMDVNGETVANLFREQAYARLIHGHTHRPGHHIHQVDGRDCQRWVLPDWREGQGAAWLECSPSGCRMMGQPAQAS